MSGFKELKVWQLSKELAVFIYKITSTGAFKSDFGLRDQIRRAADSIPSNTRPVKQLEVRLCYYTYVLQSMNDMNFYTGYTKDLKLRFEQHNKGLVESTKDRRPFKLIYYEACLNQSDAIKREKYLKTYHGKMFLYKRLKSYLAG